MPKYESNHIKLQKYLAEIDDNKKNIIGVEYTRHLLYIMSMLCVDKMHVTLLESEYYLILSL